MPVNMSLITDLRHTLSEIPEISGGEVQTARTISLFLKTVMPDELISDIAGNGILAWYHGTKAGPRTIIRCDMDAVPMENGAPRHACGHDGHMAVAAGLCAWLSENRPPCGSVGVLFQPAEETGVGAKKIMSDPAFYGENIDGVFAMHNLPGYPQGTIIIPESSACCASCGITVDLTGSPAHASMPETGVSPAMGLAEILQAFPALPDHPSLCDKFAMSTTVHASVGEPVFGVAPSRARLMATLRTETDTAIETLKALAVQTSTSIAEQHGLECLISWSDDFPATSNHKTAVNHVITAASNTNIPVITPPTPFRWSEDFGHFTRRWPGALFCMGSGENHPQLHTAEYTFPDALLEKGIKLWASLVTHLHRLDLT